MKGKINTLSATETLLDACLKLLAVEHCDHESRKAVLAQLPPEFTAYELLSICKTKFAPSSSKTVHTTPTRSPNPTGATPENTHRSLSDSLLSLGRDSSNAWVGTQPPVAATPVNLTPESNYRAPHDLHKTFNVVWLYEQHLFSDGNWRLVIDESIRLLKASGRLIIRSHDSSFGTLWWLKSVLARMPSIHADLELQDRLSDGSTITVFAVQRKRIEVYSDPSWTFGILSNGKREDRVSALIESIESIKGTRNVEYIIAGPPLAMSPAIKDQIRYIQQPKGPLARIGEKKFLILQSAANCNVAVFHDRYILNKNFFAGFDEFGYDFDFLTVTQQYEDGGHFPGYPGFSERTKIWQPSHYDIRNATLFPGHYLNGGLMILKKYLSTLVSFNRLLLHNEAEDVELSFQLADNGLVPRINVFSSATTVGVSSLYTSSFVPKS
jgi:hypothetical protein